MPACFSGVERLENAVSRYETLVGVSAIYTRRERKFVPSTSFEWTISQGRRKKYGKRSWDVFNFFLIFFVYISHTNKKKSYTTGVRV